jgi:multiple sugar transport system permease protein
MATSAASAPQKKSRFNLSLSQRDALWGYLFVAPGVFGFLVFAIGPLIASLILSFTQWNLVTDPRWIGAQNWSQVFTFSAAETPPAVDPETGENFFRCGRSKVPESQVAALEGTIEERTRRVITCSPIYTVASDVLPRGYQEITTVKLGDRVYVLGSRDPIFWKSLYNTAFLLLGIPISMALSLMIAIMLNQGLRGTSLFRAIYYLPSILPIAATALIWTWIFNPDFGLLNYFLGQVGLKSDIQWLNDRATVKPALIMMGVWGGLGFSILIYLAALQNVPRHLYEAAEIDGAGTLSRFRFITWPSLTPTTFFLLVTGMIGGFQNFVQPYIMTNGGPYFASTTTVMVIWQNAFRDLQMGYASVQAWILGFIIIVITIINFLVARRWVYYQFEA